MEHVRATALRGVQSKNTNMRICVGFGKLKAHKRFFFYILKKEGRRETSNFTCEKTLAFPLTLHYNYGCAPEFKSQVALNNITQSIR